MNLRGNHVNNSGSLLQCSRLTAFVWVSISGSFSPQTQEKEATSYGDKSNHKSHLLHDLPFGGYLRCKSPALLGSWTHTCWSLHFGTLLQMPVRSVRRTETDMSCRHSRLPVAPWTFRTAHLLLMLAKRWS